MKNIWHIWHTKHKKTLPIRCSICAIFLPFVSVSLQICNGTDTNAKPENNILFYFPLSSPFCTWFFLSPLKICLSLPSSQPCSSSSHNQTQARRRWRRQRRRRIRRTKRIWFLISDFWSLSLAWFVGLWVHSYVMMVTN